MAELHYFETYSGMIQILDDWKYNVGLCESGAMDTVRGHDTTIGKEGAKTMCIRATNLIRVLMHVLLSAMVIEPTNETSPEKKPGAVKANAPLRLVNQRYIKGRPSA